MQRSDLSQEPGAIASQCVDRTPSRERAWYTIFLLTALYVISYLDRSILALLAQPVARSLGLGDRQMAILLGLGFALFYAVGGVILAHFVDTGNRRTVVTAGVVAWSVSTVLSGFASSFWMLLLLRSGVALGEAVLTPAAVSLIADLFPRERRGLPVAVFTSVAGFMTIGSYVVGAMMVDLAGAVSHAVGLEPWQMTFVFVGLPGLLLGGIFALTATVPVRTAHHGAVKALNNEASVSALIAYLRDRLRFFGPLLSLTGLNCVYSLAIVSWLPTLLVREHGLGVSKTGYLVGLVGVPAGLLGNFFWQWRATRLQRGDPVKGVPRTLVLPAILSAPCLVAGLMSHSMALELAGFGLGLFMGTAFSVLGPIAIQLFGPERMRGRIMSLNYLIVALLGYGAGPLAAVEIGALLTSSGEGLREGLIALCVLTWPVVVLMTFAVVRNSVRAELQ